MQFSEMLSHGTIMANLQRSTPDKRRTPTKAHLQGEEWKSCYELTDIIAAIYPSTLRFPYPFALPKSSYDEMSEGQKKAVCWMWYNLFDAGRGGIIADSFENNLIQVTQFLHGLCLPKLVFKCLLIVPSQTVDMWVSALLQLAPRVRTVEYTGPHRERRLSQVLQSGGIVVMSYGVACNDIDKIAPIYTNWMGREVDSQNSALKASNGELPEVTEVDMDYVWDVIVFDQAERLKDSTSKTNAAFSRLQGNVNLLLTSQPILKNPKDLYTLFDFACEADVFGSSSLFHDRFEIPINRANSKRADDMDRQLASLARIQLAEIIDTQYWQNWDAITTPGGTLRPQVLPSFAATPTPFKDRSLASSRDTISTPSFSRTQKTGRIATGTGKKHTAKKSKPLFVPVINLEEDDGIPIALEQLENSISNLNGTAAPSSAIVKKPIEAIVLDTPPSTPTRRTPLRNHLLSVQSSTPTKLPSNGMFSTGTSTSFDASPSGFYSPVQQRQQLSFGRISLLENDPLSEKDEEDKGYEIRTQGTMNTNDSANSAQLLLQTPKRDLKQSLLSKEWASVESFLKQREAFAEKLYAEFNQIVFGGRLPLLALNWRKMSNSAGIYHYKDSSILLSKSLLTNSARLANTLAHEMAHAATHLLDDCVQDRHGPVWQKWARIVNVRYNKLIKIEVYHDYCSQSEPRDLDN